MLNDAIVVEVEEELPLQDRSTDGAAKVVIAKKLRFRPAKDIVIGIQCIILKILVCRAVEAVCTTLTYLVI